MKTEEPPLPTAPARPSTWDVAMEAEAPSWAQRYRGLLWLGGVVVVAGLYYGWQHLPKHNGPAPRRETLVVVNVPPPPPPPMPPAPVAPPPPQPEERMIEQTPVENEVKPDPTPDEPPPADLGTGLVGNGPADGFGLTGRGGGTSSGGRGQSAAQARSRWGWYAGQVQSRIQQAVRNNRTTRAANLRAEVKVWADESGRITRAVLASSTGDSALDTALRDQVLSGLQLSEPPPAGMPMPIVLRVTARRP